MSKLRSILLAALALSILVAGLASTTSTATPPSGASAIPVAAHAIAADQRFGFDAEVLERITTGNYVYLRVKDGGGAEHWAVALAATASEADRVHLWVVARAANFHSRRLDRDFAPLLFASVRSRD